jgi:hypothetical protein
MDEARQALKKLNVFAQKSICWLFKAHAEPI